MGGDLDPGRTDVTEWDASVPRRHARIPLLVRKGDTPLFF